MGRFRGRDYPGLQGSETAGWVYRRRIPDRLRPLAAKLFGIRHEFTAGLGSKTEDVLARYAAALADADRRLEQLDEEFKRRSLRPDATDGNASTGSSATSDRAQHRPSWHPVNVDACRRSIDLWGDREMRRRYEAAVNGGLPDMRSDYAGWSAWAHEGNCSPYLGEGFGG